MLAETGAHEVHPYDDPRVIAGAGTACARAARGASGPRPRHRAGQRRRAAERHGHRGARRRTRVAGSGAPSRPAPTTPTGRWRRGELVRRGARARRSPTACSRQLSARTFAILSEHVEGIVRVDDAEIVEAMRFLFERCKLVVEPSGAAGLAGVFAFPEALPERVGVILSGGNLDLGSYDELRRDGVEPMTTDDRRPQGRAAGPTRSSAGSTATTASASDGTTTPPTRTTGCCSCRTTTGSRPAPASPRIRTRTWRSSPGCCRDGSSTRTPKATAASCTPGSRSA